MQAQKGNTTFVRNLVDLSKSELNALAQQKKRKPVLVLTHPYYGVSINPGFENYFKLGKHLGRTIIILEEHQEIRNLQKKLMALNVKSSDKVFIASTTLGNPTPTMGWQKFFAKLDALKTKKIVVGGRELAKGTLQEAIKEHEHHHSNAEYSKEFGRYIDGKNITYESKDHAIAARHGLSYERTGIRAARMNAGRTYEHCAGGAWAKLKTRGKYKVKILQRQFSKGRY